MNQHKINIAFDCFSLRKIQIAATIRRCIRTALQEENITIPCEVNVLVTSDMGIQAINKASRNMDVPTDVLSFPMFQLIAGDPPKDWSAYIDPETERCPLGDMAISLERAIAQAKSFGHSERREVGYLTIHSVLHLLGYDHLDEDVQKKQMRNREEMIAAVIPGMQRER